MSDQGSSGSERAGVLGRRRQKPQAAAPEATIDLSRDLLTGLPTRAVLHDWLKQASAASRPTSTRVILAFLDLDSLRDVNDSFGPDAGDFVLRSAGERLTSLGWQGTQVLRWGGAELGVVVPGVASVDAPDQIAKALLETIGAPYTLGNQQVTIACHAGLAIASDAYATVGELVRDAHQALVSARDGGPGVYVVHDETKRGRYTTRIDEARLYSALENHEFLLHWQPIVRAGSHELFGAEGLLRWQAPGATNTGVMYPHDFLPLLEKSGLIVPVGRWVIEETCRQALAWSASHPSAPALFVTCNVGAHQLAMPDFDESVLQILASSGMPPERLCLDITEEALRYNGASTWTALRRLKDVGVKLGLGNFGTGSASLAAMRDMRLDLVRIDRVFVQELAMSHEDQTIIRHVANLAHDLGMIAIVEGVETEEEAAVLSTLGVDLAQGFLFGRPDTAEHIDLLIDPDYAVAGDPPTAAPIAPGVPGGMGTVAPPQDPMGAPAPAPAPTQPAYPAFRPDPAAPAPAPPPPPPPAG
jgi:diguanylate cyclase (GGDEF)-like protein